MQFKPVLFLTFNSRNSGSRRGEEARPESLEFLSHLRQKFAELRRASSTKIFVAGATEIFKCGARIIGRARLERWVPTVAFFVGLSSALNFAGAAEVTAFKFDF